MVIVWNQPRPDADLFRPIVIGHPPAYKEPIPRCRDLRAQGVPCDVSGIHLTHHPGDDRHPLQRKVGQPVVRLGAPGGKAQVKVIRRR